jgi:AraC-like DNA-binding protein/mannose-6-phosphate isomerase-like protein (cupin superfamily)
MSFDDYFKSIDSLNGSLREDLRSILEDLERYNEDEIFYKHCHELEERGDTKGLRAYVESCGVAYLQNQRHCILPRIFPQSQMNLEGKFEESWVFRDYSPNDITRDIFLYKHNRYMPPFTHWHDYFELFFVLSGQCVNTIQNKPMILKAGTLCFIAPHVCHSIGVYNDGLVMDILIKKTTFDEIFFNLLTAGDTVSQFFIGNLFFLKPVEYLVFDVGDNCKLMELIFTMLIEQSQNDCYSNRVMVNLVSIFFAKLMQKRSMAAVHGGQDNKGSYKDMIVYINEHFRTVTLSTVAKRFGLSTVHCSRIVKTITGRTFTALVNDIRMHHAHSLLLSSDMRIADISFSLGFENPETFIRAFKRSFNTTPARYRYAARESLTNPPEPPNNLKERTY